MNSIVNVSSSMDGYPEFCMRVCEGVAEYGRILGSRCRLCMVCYLWFFAVGDVPPGLMLLGGT